LRWLKRSPEAPAPTRRHPRVKIRGRINGRLLPRNDALILLDISRGGFAIRTAAVFSVGALHEFRLKPIEGVALRVSARVVHSQHVRDMRGVAHYDSGLQFVVDVVDTGHPQAVQAMIAALLQA
jgi:hypothetical protein